MLAVFSAAGPSPPVLRPGPNSVHATTLDTDFTALRTLLRSFGQIVLQTNAITGGCLLVAWLVYDPRLACAASMGAVAANVSAMLAGYREDDTQVGLHGFNGALAGLAAFSFIADNATAAAVAILAATATAMAAGAMVAMAAMDSVIRRGRVFQSLPDRHMVLVAVRREPGRPCARTRDAFARRMGNGPRPAR